MSSSSNSDLPRSKLPNVLSIVEEPVDVLSFGMDKTLSWSGRTQFLKDLDTRDVHKIVGSFFSGFSFFLLTSLDAYLF